MWRRRDFMLLWGGQSVSEIGSAVTIVALPLVAVGVLHATTFQVGLLSAAGTACFLLVALPAGLVVDRVAKRRLMIGCDLARMLILGSVVVAGALGALSMGQLYAVALLTGLATVFFDVAYQSYVPSLIERQQLHDANGKLGATQAFAQVAGPGLGGALYGLVKSGAMAADAVSYAVSTLSLALIRTREPARREAGGGEPAAGGAAAGSAAGESAEAGSAAAGRAAAGGPAADRAAAGGPAADGAAAGGAAARSGGRVAGLRREMFAGLAFVFGHPVLRKIAACTGTANLFGSIAGALEVVFLYRVVRVPAASIGLLFSLGSLGGILGGVLSGRLARWIGSARIIWFSMLVFGVIPILMPLTAHGWRLALFPIAFAGLSFTAVVYNIAQLSYRQLICPPELLGRMNAAIRWIVWGTLPLGGLIGGVLGSLVGVRPTIWVGVLGSWAAAFWVVFSPLRRMRDIPADEIAGHPPVREAV